MPETTTCLLCREEVIVKLQKLEDGIANLILLKQHDHDEMKQLIVKHDHLLLGNGQDGLVVRIDRTEQIEKSRLWAWRSVFGCVVGLVLKSLFDLFVRR